MEPARRSHGTWGWLVALFVALPLLAGCPTSTPPIADEPRIESFTADADTIAIGATTTLRWTVTNATGLTLHDGTDELTLDPTTNLTAVTPNATTTYTLTATNDDGASAATTGVTVKAPADIGGLVHEIVLGSQARLAWSSDQAEGFRVFAVAAGGDAEPIGGTLDGGAREATVPIPTAARQTLRVCAIVVGLADACAETALTNVVTTAADWDPYFLEGFSSEPEIAGSLRSVISAAEPGSVVGFAADVTDIDLRGVDLIWLGGWRDAHLILGKDLTISGPPGNVTLRGVSGAGLGDPGDPFTYRSRMVYVVPGVTVRLDRLVLTGGTFIYRGGALRNDGDLTITRSVIAGNRAWLSGGGIYNFDGAVLRVEDSLLEDNRAVTEIDEIGQTYAIRGGYVICMDRASFGGGLYNTPGAVATFVDTPIRGNEATVLGGGVYNAGSLTLIRSPVTQNRADHTVYTADPAYPAPPDYVDHPDCNEYAGPFTPTSRGGGIFQAAGATLERIDSPVTGNLVDDLYEFIGVSRLDVTVVPDGEGDGARDR